MFRMFFSSKFLSDTGTGLVLYIELRSNVNCVLAVLQNS